MPGFELKIPEQQWDTGVPDPDYFVRQNGGGGGSGHFNPNGDERDNIISDRDYSYRSGGGFGASANMGGSYKKHSRDDATELSGFGGDDTISGHGGNDTLHGGTGNDWLYAGEGSDLAFGDQGADRLEGENGNDTMWGGSSRDKLFGGNGDDDLHGNEDADSLIGDAGRDTLEGGSGADFMRGGEDSDVYVVDDAGDWIDEEAGPAAGTEDKVYTSLSAYDMAQQGKSENVEVLQYVGQGDFTGRGNALDNVLVGAAGNDRLYGRSGSDLVNGGDGADTLDGGQGNDTLNGEGGPDAMYGGSGNDVYIVDNAGDTVMETASRSGSDGLRLWLEDGGQDKIYTTIDSYNMGTAGKGAGVEELQYTGNGSFHGVGNARDNWLVGAAGNDTLDGSTGNDSLAGGDGRDVFAFRDGAGHDTITDFTPGLDKINLAGVSDVESFDDLDFTNTDGGVLVEFGDSSALVVGQTEESMSEADFSFTPEPGRIGPLPPFAVPAPKLDIFTDRLYGDDVSSILQRAPALSDLLGSLDDAAAPKGAPIPETFDSVLVGGSAAGPTLQHAQVLSDLLDGMNDAVPHQAAPIPETFDSSLGGGTLALRALDLFDNAEPDLYLT